MAATRTPQPGPNTPLSTQTRGGSFLLLFLEPNTAKAGSLRARPPGSFVRPAILARSAAKPAGRIATTPAAGNPPPPTFYPPLSRAEPRQPQRHARRRPRPQRRPSQRHARRRPRPAPGQRRERRRRQAEGRDGHGH